MQRKIEETQRRVKEEEEKIKDILTQFNGDFLTENPAQAIPSSASKRFGTHCVLRRVRVTE